MAETHLRKAAEQDLPEAQTALSNLCARGGGVATDFTSELRLVGAAQANAQCTRGLCVPDDAEIHRPEEPQAIESAPVNELKSDYRLQLLRDSLPGSEPDIARPAGTHTTPDREIALHSGDQEWLRPHKFPGIARRIAFVALCTIAIASALIAGFSVLHGNHEVEAIITRILSNISSGTIPGSAAGPSEAVTEIPVSKKQVVIADSSQIPKPSRSAGLDSAVSGPPQRVAAGVQAKASATGSEAEASLKSEGGQLNAIEQSNHATAVSPDPAAHQPIPLIAHSTSIARREAPATARHLDTGPPGASESLEAEGTAPSDPTVLSEAPSITPTQAAKAADSEPGQTYATEPAGAAKTAPALVAAEAVGSGLEIPAVASAAADEAEHRLTEAGHSVNNAANLAVAAPAKHPDVALPPAHGMTDASRMSRATESTLEERRIKNAEADFLIMRGDAFFAAGDLTSARHFYEYAAAAGNGAAALRLGCTFDPAFLARAHVGRVQGDLPTALYWYRRARDLGNADAETLLRGVENTMR